MVKIQIDNKIYDVEEGKNLLEVCLTLGLNLPYFCYHPAMGSVGACRQCAVKKYKDVNDKKGKIIMSCMEPVIEGMIVSIEDHEAKAFRKSIVESLMLNHPHDCPVCDEGGECHLQDMTMMTGHNYRRSEKKKRTYKNQYLGPFINHEMNRCIQCYRCVRFYKDYAGGKDFGVFGSHDHVYFGRHEEGILESEFSGNLVEVCPTGVFTDKTLKPHYTRKWDLTNSPSICTKCSVGCNIIISERYREVRRIISRYHGSVNGYFICDRGRFGNDFVKSDQRITEPVIKNTGDESINQKMKNILSSGIRIVGIGSPKASLEANYTLQKLVGKENFYHGVPKNENNRLRRGLEILNKPNIHSPSLKEIEKADAVFIIGVDVSAAAPMMALALRQAARSVPVSKAVKMKIPLWQDEAIRNAIQNQKSPFYIACSKPSDLDELASKIYRDDITELLRSMLESSGNNIPSEKKEKTKEISTEIFLALKNASNPLIITGISDETDETLDLVAELLTIISSPEKKPMLAFIIPQCNSMGLGMIDGNSWEDLSDSSDKFSAIILENDILKNENILTRRFLENCESIIILDHSMNKTCELSDIVLPAATFTESEGTFVNYEGRAQRFYKVISPTDSIKSSWEWLNILSELKEISQVSPWKSLKDVLRSMTDDIPLFMPLRKHDPETDYRMLNEKIKRQTPRFSGRTAIMANLNVHEPKPPVDKESPLVFSMEGGEEKPPSDMVPFYWIPGWNSNQSMNFYLDEPNGHMKGGDPGIRLITD